MQVDLSTHRYQAWAGQIGMPVVGIASNYAFRTEQSAVQRLDVVSRMVDMSGAFVQFCDLTVQPNQCHPSMKGSGWNSTGFVRQSGKLRVEFDVAAIGSAVDGVVGVSNGAPAAFRDLAAIFRFNPDGFMDVRNGSTYTADTEMPYQLGETYHVYMDLDVAAHRYSVKVSHPQDAVPEPLASGYAFEVTIVNDPQQRRFGEVIQGMAREAGFNITLRPSEFASALTDDDNGKLQAFAIGWSGRADPDGNIHQFQTCGGSLNTTHACDEAVDALLNRAREISDQGERAKLYREAIEKIQARRNVLYVYHLNYIVAYPKNLKGYKAVPDGLIRIKGVTWN